MDDDATDPVPDIANFSVPVVGTSASRAAWSEAWRRFLHFTGDPFAALADASRNDDTFAMGPAFVALYSVLGATSPSAPIVADSLRLVRERTARDEQAHLGALEAAVRGDFVDAADRYGAIALDVGDFAAARFAHDLYLHAGDAVGRLRLAEAATAEWPLGSPGGSFVAGQYAFALEEVGEYVAAEAVGRDALAADADDLWARHALAHVYESTDDQAAALELLEPSIDRWRHQDALATHVWWHLGLRHLRAGNQGRVWEIYDTIIETATTPYRMADATSLLWRLELAGLDVEPRWDEIVDRWAAIDAKHASAFIDVHAALAFARRPDHDAAREWVGGAGRPVGFAPGSENDRIFSDVVQPTVMAVGEFARGEYADSAANLRAVLGDLHRIGGSVAQRDIVRLTIDAAVDRDQARQN